MSLTGSLATSLGVCLTLSACRGQSPKSSASVTDSRGITIVTSEPPGQATPVWRVATDSSLVVIGAKEDPATSLTLAPYAAVGPDGLIYVADQHDYFVRVFDRSGQLVAKLGRMGDGPGELQEPPPLLFKGDTLVTLSLFRLTYFDPGHAVIRTVAVEQGNAGDVLANDLVFRPDGRLVALAIGDQACVAPGPKRPSIRVLTISPEGKRDAVLLEVPADERFCAARETPGAPKALTLAAVAYGKSSSVVASSDAIFAGVNDGFEIKRYDLEGRLQRVIRVLGDPVPLPQEWKDAFIAEQRDDWDRQNLPPAVRAAAERQLLEVRFAEAIPPYEGLIATREDGLWVRKTRQRTDAPQEFVIFDSAGRMVAIATLPPRITPLSIWGDTMLARRKGEDDIRTIELYRIVR